ncbi:MAG: hypothetical protein RLZZ219_884, partial [Cyanobacteriota bacterium]
MAGMRTIGERGQDGSGSPLLRSARRRHTGEHRRADREL